MVKICPVCGYANKSDANFCGKCNADLKEVVALNEAELPAPVKEKFWSVFDTFSIIGFVAALFGIFIYAVVLLPVGLVASIIGLKSRYLKGLSISGIIISILAVVIKILVVLYTYDLIPQWITQGIFF